MSIKEEWQLVAHQPDLTPAEGAVAQAIARRIKPQGQSLPIPIRTLLAESVGVKSKATIESALARLEALGVIRLAKPLKGSRLPSVISWSLECPGECQLDHARGNTRLPETRLERELAQASSEHLKETTRPNPQDTTRPNPQDALTIKERERSSLVSFIAETIEALPSQSSKHKELLEALETPEVAAIRQRAEMLLIKADLDPWNYLRAIVTKSPHQLMPKPQASQAPPDFSHLAPEIAEAQRRKWLARSEAS